jgi:hypothetical protein
MSPDRTAYDEGNKSRAVYLGVRFIHSTIILETAFATNESIYDEYTAGFSEMLCHGIELKRLTAQKSKTTNRTFDLGAVLPLYFIATKCRVRDIRKLTVETLQQGSRREEIWDNLLLAKMAAWVQRLEEECIEEDVAPEWARVEVLETSFELDRGIVKMKCRNAWAKILAIAKDAQ